MNKVYHVRSLPDYKKAFDEIVEKYNEKEGNKYVFCSPQWQGKISASAALLYLMGFFQTGDLKIDTFEPQIIEKRLLIHSIINKSGIFGEHVENNIDILAKLKSCNFWDEIDWVEKWWKPMANTQGIDYLGYLFVYGGRKSEIEITEGDYSKMIEALDDERKKEFIQSCVRIYSIGVIRGWGGGSNHKKAMSLIGGAEKKYGRVYIESEIVSYIWKNILPSGFLFQNNDYLSFTKWILKHSEKEDRYNMFLWTCCQIVSGVDVDGMWRALADYPWDGKEEITPWVSNYPPTPLIDYIERIGTPSHPIGRQVVKSIIDKSFLEREIGNKSEDDEKGGKKKGRLM